MPRSRRRTRPPQHSQTPAAVGGRPAGSDSSAPGIGEQGRGVQAQLRKDRALTSSGAGGGAGWEPDPELGHLLAAPSTQPLTAQGRERTPLPAPFPPEAPAGPEGQRAGLCPALVVGEGDLPPKRMGRGASSAGAPCPAQRTPKSRQCWPTWAGVGPEAGDQEAHPVCPQLLFATPPLNSQ